MAPQERRPSHPGPGHARARKIRIELKALEGGITVSGGEPLLQPSFTCNILRCAKERFDLHPALDTAGQLGHRLDDGDLAAIDLILLDVKSSNRELHRRLTGAEPGPTLAFARRLADLGRPVWLRFVLVPHLTDARTNIEGVAEFAAGLGNIERVDVLPFHQLGRFKYGELGLPYELAETLTPDREALDRAKRLFRRHGLLAP